MPHSEKEIRHMKGSVQAQENAPLKLGKRIQRELVEKGGSCLRPFIVVFKDSWRGAGSGVYLAPEAASWQE